jgi:hypothetical protein
VIGRERRGHIQRISRAARTGLGLIGIRGILRRLRRVTGKSYRNPTRERSALTFCPVRRPSRRSRIPMVVS